MTDIIMVKLNDKEYPTHMVNGVQRFVTNPVVDRVMDMIGEAYERLGYARFQSLGLHGMNEIAMEYHMGRYSVDDMLDFYTQIGYSVSGMLGLSFFEDVTVENPLWDK